MEHVPAEQRLYLKVNAKNTRQCPPTGKCTQEEMFENVHSTWENLKLLLSRNKEWRQPNIEQTNNDGHHGTLGEKEEEIWLSPETKTPTPTEQSKKQRDNIKTPPKTLISQLLQTDLGRSVGVTAVTQLVWLNRYYIPLSLLYIYYTSIIRAYKKPSHL